ncbi:MAG: response regulator [Elusimicrobiota bacterium]|jgi:DNA-binding response OmpR family regulator
MSANILIVEDDEEFQQYLSMTLTKAGYHVAVTGTARAARDSFHAHPPDLVLLDIELPDGNGIELCREWGLDQGGGSRVIFLTGYGDASTRIKCFGLGAQDFIPKPVNVEELLARVRVHAANKLSQDELLRRNQELELHAQVRQATTDLIVHDLRNPLSTIKGTLAMTRKRGLISDAVYVGLLGSAESAAEFMTLMLNDLLDLSSGGKRLQVEITRVEVAPILARLPALFDSYKRNCGISLEYSVAPSVACLNTDRKLLFRLLANLSLAAVRGSPRNAAVHLDCAPTEGRARFTVADRGPGIPDADKAGIFPSQLPSQFKDSSVVGMAFCRMAVDALSGKIWAEDQPGGGTLYRFELPTGPSAL